MMLRNLFASIRTKGVLCTFWFHRDWYVDSAMIMSVKRCGHCGHPEAPGMLRLLESERLLWGDVPKSLSVDEQSNWVRRRFFEVNGTL